MAKRQRNRNISWISATPTLIRVKGEPANTKLRRAVAQEVCEVCGDPCTVSRTIQQNSNDQPTRIQRLCLEHYPDGKKKKKADIPPEILAMIEEARRRDMSTWNYHHSLTLGGSYTTPTGNVDPHTGKPTYRAK